MLISTSDTCQILAQANGCVFLAQLLAVESSCGEVPLRGFNLSSAMMILSPRLKGFARMKQ